MELKINIMDFDTQYQKRIVGELQKGIDYPLLLIEAAWGYGKSELLSACLEKNTYPYSWVRLHRMDNWEFFFWQHFVDAIIQLHPNLAEALKQIDFPDTLFKMSKVFDFLRLNTRKDKRVVLVIENYNILDNKRILLFLESLIETGPENICLVVISNQETNLRDICVQSNVGIYYVGVSELRLTLEEVQEVFELFRIPLAEDQARKLIEKWDGWLLPILLLAAESDALSAVDVNNQIDVVQQIFYRHYYSAYPERVRKILVQLSLFDQITMPIINRLGDSSEAVKMTLEQSPFVYIDRKKNTLHIRQPYRDFLSGYQNALSETDRMVAFKVAADMMLEEQKYDDALPLLIQCEQYEAAVLTIGEVLSSYLESSMIRYYLYQHSKMPASFVEKNTKARLQNIVLRFLCEEIDEVGDDIDRFLEQVESGIACSREMLGEFYFLKAYITAIQGHEDCLDYFRMASECLPDGSRYLRDYPLRLAKINLRLPDYRAGALDRAAEFYSQYVSYLKILLQHDCGDLEKLYIVQIAFYTYRLNEAAVLAREIAYSAELEQHHELVLVSWYYLSRIAMMQGDLDHVKKTRLFFEQYVERFNLNHLKGLQARLYGLISIYVGKADEVPHWIAEQGAQRGAIWESVRNGVIQACYMLETNQYLEVIALVNHLEKIGEKACEWLNLLYIKLYRAVAYLRLGQKEQAMKDLEEVYEMTYENGFITPLIECAGGMRSLLDTAKKLRPNRFDQDWLNNIYAKSSGYARKISKLRKHFTERQASPHMTVRRQQVLELLAHGNTVEEIAEDIDIAEATVRTHIQHIYNELGALNRADAIRIAKERKLI